MKRYEKKAPLPPPTAADEWATATREKCARAAAHWLKETINTMRPINSLKLPELMALAENVTATWIVEASHRVGRAPTEEEDKRLMSILG
jgi:hypothetical protein